jgi:DNA-binding Lrp family transcriptional regulator
VVRDEKLWHLARRLRSNGHSLVQISKKTGIPVSTLSYRFKKRRESGIDEGPIRIIHALEFTPEETVISLSPYDFEKNRVSNELYTTGVDLYEIRHGIIHHTRLPETPCYVFTWNGRGLRKQSFSVSELTQRMFHGTDYPQIAEVIEHNPEWNYLIVLKHRFDLFLKQYARLLRREFVTEFDYSLIKNSIAEMFSDMPRLFVGREGITEESESPTDLLLYMHNNSLTPEKTLKRYINKAKEIRKKIEKLDDEVLRLP